LLIRRAETALLVTPAVKSGTIGRAARIARILRGGATDGLEDAADITGDRGPRDDVLATWHISLDERSCTPRTFSPFDHRIADHAAVGPHADPTNGDALARAVNHRKELVTSVVFPGHICEHTGRPL